MYTLLGKPDEICDKCCQKGINMVRPCNNEICTARMHVECLENQVKDGKLECDKCNQSIYSTKIKKLDTESCCCTIVAIGIVGGEIILNIIMFLLTFGFPSLWIVSAFGYSINGLKTDNGGVLLSVCIIVGLITVFYCIGFFAWLSACTKEKIVLIKCIQYPYNIYFVFLVIGIGINIIILICHGVGYFVMRRIFHIEESLTVGTFLSGLITLILCIILITIICGIVWFIIWLYKTNLVDKTVYGVFVDRKTNVSV